MLEEARPLPASLEAACSRLRSAFEQQARLKGLADARSTEAHDEARAEALAADAALEGAEGKVAEAKTEFERRWAQGDTEVTTLQRRADDVQLAMMRLEVRIGEVKVAEARASLLEGARAMEREIVRVTAAAEAITRARSHCAAALASFGGEVALRLHREGAREHAAVSSAGRLAAPPVGQIDPGTADVRVRATEGEWQAAVGAGSPLGQAESGWVGNLRDPVESRKYWRNGLRAIELREGPGGTPMLSVVDPRATARRPSAAVWPGRPPVTGSTMDMTPRGDDRALWNGRLGGGGLGSW